MIIDIDGDPVSCDEYMYAHAILQIGEGNYGPYRIAASNDHVCNTSFNLMHNGELLYRLQGCSNGDYMVMYFVDEWEPLIGVVRYVNASMGIY